MKRSRKLVATLIITIAIAATSTTAKAGIIVGLTKDSNTSTKCEVTKVESKTRYSFDHGIIVGLTGIIVGLTGIIVGYADDDSTCGHIPTSD